MRLVSSILCVTVLTFVTPVNNSHAQLGTDLMSGSMGAPVSIELNQSYPTPGEQINASLNDYSINSVGSSITWSYTVTGEDTQTVSNERSITVIAPAAGQSATLAVSLTNPQGQTLQASRTITAQYLDIIVEPNTYSPPFYRGRALPIYGSQVRLTALLHSPDGLVNPNNYSYTWSLNNKPVSGGSVRGDYQSMITIPYGSSQIIGIEIANQQGQVVSRRNVLLPVGEIDIQLYENHPLYGLRQRVLQDDHSLISESTTITAVPYNLDINSIQRGLITQWRVNNQRTDTNGNPFEITLRREGRGSATVAFQIRNSIERLQAADQAITVNF